MGNTLIGNTRYFHYPDDYPCAQLEETSYADLKALKHCVTDIKGMKANSASTTDIYILNINGTKYFMKLFITGLPSTVNYLVDPANPSSVYDNNIHPLIYEYGVYLGKINRLIKYNICPFFVETMGGSLRNNRTEIINFLEHKLVNALNLPVQRADIRNNFSRNIKILLHNTKYGTTHIKGRPSINDNVPFPAPGGPVPLSGDVNATLIDDYFKFGYFITKSFNTVKPSGDILSYTHDIDNERNIFFTKKSPSTDLYVDNLNIIDDRANIRYWDPSLFGGYPPLVAGGGPGPYINGNVATRPAQAPIGNAEERKIFNNLRQLYLLFNIQYAIAIKSLELTKIVNCDLHMGNILLENNINIDNIFDPSNRLTTENHIFTYFIEDQKYDFNFPFMIKVYDFDRSYIYGDSTNNSEIKNKQGSVHPFYNKSNIRDYIFTISTYIYSTLFPVLMKNIHPVTGIIKDIRHRAISNIINDISSAIMRINTHEIPIYWKNAGGVATLMPYDNTIKQQIMGLGGVAPVAALPVFSYLTLKSKRLIEFIYNLFEIKNSLYPLDRSQEGWVRNKYIDDMTFTTHNIFNNFDNIISKLYSKIDPIFKQPGCINNDCVMDNNINKYYMSRNMFMPNGILDKTEYYKYINTVYRDDNVNKINTKDQEIARLKQDIQQNQQEIARLNQTIQQRNRNDAMEID